MQELLEMQWDEFIYWAKRFRDWPRFDAEERDYKQHLAERIYGARTLLQAKEPTWTTALRKAVSSSDNNFTSWRIHSPFVKWVDQNPSDAAAAIGYFWADEPSISNAVQSFIAAASLPPKAGISGPITLASVLLAGVDVRLYPPYRREVYFKGYD